MGRGHFDHRDLQSLRPGMWVFSVSEKSERRRSGSRAASLHYGLNEVAILEMLRLLLGCGGDNYLHIWRKLLRGQAWLLPEIR